MTCTPTTTANVNEHEVVEHEAFLLYLKTIVEELESDGSPIDWNNTDAGLQYACEKLLPTLRKATSIVKAHLEQLRQKEHLSKLPF